MSSNFLIMIKHGIAKAVIMDITTQKVIGADVLDYQGKDIDIPKKIADFILKRLTRNGYIFTDQWESVAELNFRDVEFTYVEVEEGFGAIAIRNPMDKFSKVKGADIAIGRALKAAGIRRTRKRRKVLLKDIEEPREKDKTKGYRMITDIIDIPRTTYIDIETEKLLSQNKDQDYIDSKDLQSPFVVQL